MALSDTIVGIIGNIISICMFLAPVKTFRKIFKAKSTMEYKSFPYVCTLLSVMLWTFYGLLKPATLIVTINGAGTILEALYLGIFFYYADKRRKVRTAESLLGVFAIFGVVLTLTLTVTGAKHTKIIIAGVVSVAFSIVMYASPLRAMKMVIVTKSVIFMPFTLSLLLFINGAVWLLYALLVDDIYVMIPNGVGLFFGAVQLILYVTYMKRSKKIEAAKRLQEAENPTKDDNSAALDMESLKQSQTEKKMKVVQDVDKNSEVQPAKVNKTIQSPVEGTVPDNLTEVV